MCICAAPAQLSNTKLYVGEAEYNNKYVHVLAYQNDAASTNKWEPNAMILPFPTNVAMGRDNIINSSSYPDFLKNITDASKIQRRTLGDDSLRSFSFGVAAKGFDVFESGSYTVILADSIKHVPEAMSQVADDKRIALQYRFVHGFSKLYPDQPVAVCLWKGSIKPEPLLWWYEPKDKSTLFIPTMDAHDGGAPDLEANVDTDHIISVGSNLLEESRRYNRVHYTDSLNPTARQLLPMYVYGTELPGRMKNGDIFVKTADLRMKGEHLRYPTIKRGLSWDNENWEDKMFGWHA